MREKRPDRKGHICCTTKDCECCNSGDFARLEIKARTRVDISKRELDQVTGEIGRDILQAFNDALSAVSINFFQLFPSTLVTILFFHFSLL